MCGAADCPTVGSEAELLHGILEPNELHDVDGALIRQQVVARVEIYYNRLPPCRVQELPTAAQSRGSAVFLATIVAGLQERRSLTCARSLSGCILKQDPADDACCRETCDIPWQ